MAEKTEQPTAKKLRDARKKGQVARSREAGSAAVLAAAFGVLWIRWEVHEEELRSFVLLPSLCYGLPFHDAMALVLQGAIRGIVRLSLPVLAAVAATGVLANFLQIGALFAVEAAKPSLKKISPAEGFKRIFSLANLVELLKSAAKILFLSVLLYGVLRAAVPALVLAPNFGLPGLLAVLSEILKQIALYTAGAFAVVAVIDFFFQRHDHLRKLKMTRDEVKQEYKEMEGDPLVRSMRRQLHRELAMADTLQKVRKATVLITNPARLAVALFYDEDRTKLPVVTAKGENLLARRMIEVAREEDIPVMENVPLARDLFDHGEIDRYIPSELIRPVAEVLRWIRKVRRERDGI